MYLQSVINLCLPQRSFFLHPVGFFWQSKEGYANFWVSLQIYLIPAAIHVDKNQRISSSYPESLEECCVNAVHIFNLFICFFFWRSSLYEFCPGPPQICRWGAAVQWWKKLVWSSLFFYILFHTYILKSLVNLWKVYCCSYTLPLSSNPLSQLQLQLKLFFFLFKSRRCHWMVDCPGFSNDSNSAVRHFHCCSSEPFNDFLLITYFHFHFTYCPPVTSR